MKKPICTRYFVRKEPIRSKYDCNLVIVEEYEKYFRGKDYYTKWDAWTDYDYHQYSNYSTREPDLRYRMSNLFFKNQLSHFEEIELEQFETHLMLLELAK
jgi:hypothetical protein